MSDRQKIPLFVELCAGTAALSLRLHSKSGKPPVSRQGSKQGYADAILRVLGLHAGQGAEEYFWSDPDEGVRMLLYTYMDHIFAEQVSEKIRSWAHKDPAEHWSAETPSKTEGDVLRAASWIWRKRRSIRGVFVPPHRERTATSHGGSEYSACAPSKELDALPILTASIFHDAREVPVEAPDGTVVYIDPPYENTAGYDHSFSREEWLPVARRWAEAGATVCISESQPISQLMDEGWFSREITWARSGSYRNMSKQQREFLTMNRPGVHPGRPKRPLLQKRKGTVLK